MLTKELEIAKSTLGIHDDDIFDQWQTEELEYLKTLQNNVVSIEDKLAMEYVDVLKHLKKARYAFTIILGEYHTY